MNRVLALAIFTASVVSAQVANTAICPFPLQPDTVPRVVTVVGTGFDPTTNATWQDNSNATLAERVGRTALGRTPTATRQVGSNDLQVEFVSSTAIRVTIPGNIGTDGGTSGYILISTQGTTQSVRLSFDQEPYTLEPGEFTTQQSSVTFAVFGLKSSATFSVLGLPPLPLSPNPAGPATATVQANWPAGPQCVVISNPNYPLYPMVYLPLTINPAPTIASTGSFRLYAGQTSTVDLAVTGGTPGNAGFQWNVTPALPAWIGLQTTGLRTARLVGSLPATSNSDAFTGQVTATDGLQSLAVSSTSLPVPFVVDAVPDPVLTGIPGDHKLQPDQQYTIQFGTDRATPIELTGTIVLQSSTAQFVVGATLTNTVSFDIPPNCVMCNSTFTVQAGTAAGTVPVTVLLNQTPPNGAGTPPAVNYPPFTVTQDPALPHIDTARISACQFPGGFIIFVPGYTNTREMVTASFQFAAANGETISAPPTTPPSPAGTLSRDVTKDFANWFTAQNPQGGFTLPQYFNVTGDIRAVSQASGTLTNTIGQSIEFGPIAIAGAPRCN